MQEIFHLISVKLVLSTVILPRAKEDWHFTLRRKKLGLIIIHIYFSLFICRTMGDKTVRILYCKIVFSNVLETFILLILQDNVGFLKRLRKAQHLNNTELESPCDIPSKGSFLNISQLLLSVIVPLSRGCRLTVSFSPWLMFVNNLGVWRGYNQGYGINYGVLCFFCLCPQGLVFTETNIRGLQQINCLSLLRRLEHLSISSEGNPITSFTLWKPYVLFRLAHFSLRKINDIEVSFDYVSLLS